MSLYIYSKTSWAAGIKLFSMSYNKMTQATGKFNANKTKFNTQKRKLMIVHLLCTTFKFIILIIVFIKNKNQLESNPNNQ